jgi:hypothetical protein
MKEFLGNNLILLSVLLAVFVILVILLLVWVLMLRKKMKIFLKGTKVMDVEDVVTEQTKIIKEIKKDIRKLHDWNKDLQKICDISITKVGVIRFNPFRDTGGDQSFVIALLDSHNNGVVLSALYTREGTRVYTKPIEKGISSYHLSREEEEAIKKAIHG